MKQKVIIEGSTKEPEDYKIYYEEKPEDAEEHNAMRSVLYDEQTEERRQNQISGIAHQDKGDLTNVVTEALILLYQDKIRIGLKL